MSKSNRTIIQAVFLAVFIITGSFNLSYGQAKVDKLDKLISTYTEYGQFNGSVLIADKGKVIYKKVFGLADMEWNVPNHYYSPPAHTGASLVFDTKDKHAITMVLFGRISFREIK